ncbi:SprB repeat-containing protein, partial [Flavobacterium sp. GSP11]
MKKFIFYKIKSVQEYCLTFSWRFFAGFSKFSFTVPLNRLSNLGFGCWLKSLALSLMFGAILMTGYTANAQLNIQGVAPVSSPKNGSGVDGDLNAHQTAPNAPTAANPYGDLFDFLHPSTPASGYHGLINVTPPVPPATTPPLGLVFNKPTVPASVPSTYQLSDFYQNDVTIFPGSNKINDNPNTYAWGPGVNANKGEIQNAGVHFSFGDPDIFPGPATPGHPIGRPGDLWCLFAGDRQTTNGSAFIAFEFLQKRMALTNVNLGPIDNLTGVAPIIGLLDPTILGGFTSDGLEGGRTKGDKLVTIEFDGGGKLAIVFIHTWSEKKDKKGVIIPNEFEYVLVDLATLNNAVFCTNNTVPSPVPFDVFGTNPGTYAVNQYAEGAINLTEVFGSSCVVISTVFIVTRSSGSSSSSELYDFPGAPIQLNLSLSPAATAVATAAPCFGGNGSVNLTVVGGTGPFTYAWTATNGGSIPSGQEDDEDLTSVPAGTYSVIVTDSKGCGDTATATVTQPAAALSSTKTSVDVLCYGGATGSIDLSPSGGTPPYAYAWTTSDGAIPAGQADDQDLT